MFWSVLPLISLAAPVERTAAVNPDVMVSLEGQCSAWTVSAAAGPTLRLSGDAPEDLSFSADPRRVRVVVDEDRRDDCATLSVQLPPGAHLSVETVSGAVLIGGLTGTVKVETVSGDIQVEQSEADLDVETVSGQVRVRGPARAVSIETVSGEVNVVGVQRELEVDSVSGRVHAEGGTLSRLKLSTVSADIELRATPAPGLRGEIESHSGRLTVTLPQGSSTTLEASSFSGRIRSAVGEVEQAHGPQRALNATLGAGDGLLELTTFSGDLTIAVE